MPTVYMRTAGLLAILLLVLPSRSQNKAPDSDPKSVAMPKDAPKSEMQRFYFHSWGKGEFKICESYSEVPNVVVRDSADDIEWKNSILNLIADNTRRGMTEEQTYREALAFASKHGKTFLANFSDDPWPKPQTGFKLSVWNCTKDNNTITCGLGGRTSKTTTGE